MSTSAEDLLHHKGAFYAHLAYKVSELSNTSKGKRELF